MTTERSGGSSSLLSVGVIAAVLLGAGAAVLHLRRTLEDCRRAEAAAAVRLVWYFAERPDPADFEVPEAALVCAPTRVTATSPVRTAERRIGGPVAVDVDLRIEENVPALALGGATELRVGFHLTARPGLSSALRDTAKERDVDTVGVWKMPVGRSLYVMLCRMDRGHVVTYAPMR